MIGANSDELKPRHKGSLAGTERRSRGYERTNTSSAVYPVRAEVVGSAWGAVPGLLQVRFPRPPSEPDVRFSPHPALHEVKPWG